MLYNTMEQVSCGVGFQRERGGGEKGISRFRTDKTAQRTLFLQRKMS